MGPVLRLLTAASACWPQPFVVSLLRNMSLPRASKTTGISGTIPKIPINTQAAIANSVGKAPGGLISLLEAAFHAMREEGTLWLNQATTALAGWTKTTFTLLPPRRLRQ